MEQLKFILVVIIAFFIGYIVGRLIKYTELKKARKDTAKRARSIILGETAEKIAPFLSDMNYHPKDMVFIGKGVDYVVFDGLSSGKLNQIIFLEINTQNINEKQIEKIIKLKKVKYELKHLKL